LKKNEKTSLLASGLILCGLIVSGLPAYFVSLFGSPISKEGVFYIIWGMFCIPFGLIFAIFLIQWYREKTKVYNKE